MLHIIQYINICDEFDPPKKYQYPEMLGYQYSIYSEWRQCLPSQVSKCTISWNQSQ